MNSHTEDHTPLQPWTDPELEARVVALILGEASDFEREEIKRHLAEQPELRLFKERIEEVHGLLGGREEQPDWRLSEERRAKVLAAIAAESKSKSPQSVWTHPAFRIAATLVILGAVAAAMFVSFPDYSPSAGIRESRVAMMDAQSPVESDEIRWTAPEPVAAGTRLGTNASEVAPSSVPSSPGSGFLTAGVEHQQELPAEFRFRLRTEVPKLPEQPAVAAKAKAPRNLPFLSSASPPPPPASGQAAEEGVEWQSQPGMIRTDSMNRAGSAAIERSGMAPPASPPRPTAAAPAPAKPAARARTLAEADESSTLAQKSLPALSQAGGEGFGIAPQGLVGDKLAMNAPAEPEPVDSLSGGGGRKALGALAASGGSAVAGQSTGAIRDTRTTVDNGRVRLAPPLKMLDGPDEAALRGERLLAKKDEDGTARGLQRSSDMRRDSEVQPITEKLKETVIPEIDFQEVPLSKALEELQKKIAENDPNTEALQRGVNVINRASSQQPQGPAGTLAFDDAAGEPRINLQLKDVPAAEALRYVAELGRMKYKVEPHGVVILPATEGNADLYTEVIRVPPSFLTARSNLGAPGAALSGDPFASLGNEPSSTALQAKRTAKDELQNVGVTFPPDASAIYDPATGQLIVRNTQANLDLIEAYIDSLEDEGAAAPLAAVLPKRDRIATGPISTPEAIQTATQLQSTILPSVEFNGTPLRDAVAELQRQLPTVKFDLPAEAEARASHPIHLKLTRISAQEALRYVAELASLRSVVTPTGEVRLSRDRLPDTAYAYQLPAALWEFIQKQQDSPKSIREIFESAGITFPAEAELTYDPVVERLQVYQTAANIDLIEAFLDAQFAKWWRSQPQAKPAPPETKLEIDSATEPFSTFSLHVSDVSFQLAQAALAKNEWPEKESVRIEEFVNAFDYGDPSPDEAEPVACRIEQAAHPFLQQRNLLRFGVRTASTGRGASSPLRLTLLLDRSGSMERPDRQETVQRALEQLAAEMRDGDELTVIAFARQPRLVVDRANREAAAKLPTDLAAIPTEGGTNLEAALSLAAQKARATKTPGAQNRIVLLTDGAANLGDAHPDRLAERIHALRQEGIAFDAAGIGADGLNDTILEALTRKGDGRYYLLNGPEDAGEGFARKLAGAFRPGAKDVKVQIQFNPDRVGRYRLLGFEEHRLEKEEFRDDTVDAAELASEEAGVAVYQVEVKPDGSGDVGFVSVRFLDVASGERVERRWLIPFEPMTPGFDQAPPSLQLAGLAAWTAAKLKDDPAAASTDWPSLSRIHAGLPEAWKSAPRVRGLGDVLNVAQALARE